MKQLFYVFDEHTDYIKECIKIGMKPIGNYPFVREFEYDGVVYKALSVHDCYSGWTITLMALPYMNYEQLIMTLKTSKIYDEIVGCLGMLLKNHASCFEKYISQCRKPDKTMKRIKRIICNDIASNCTPVSKMDNLLRICK